MSAPSPHRAVAPGGQTLRTLATMGQRVSPSFQALQNQPTSPQPAASSGAPGVGTGVGLPSASAAAGIACSAVGLVCGAAAPAYLPETPLKGLPKPPGPRNTMVCPPARTVHPPAAGMARGSRPAWAAASATLMLSSKASLSTPTAMPPPQSLTWTPAARSPWPSLLPHGTACLAPSPTAPAALRSTTPSMNRTWTCLRWAVAPCRAGRSTCLFSRS
uniref:Uncharacterized protein n=1 Tax=Mus musculus TaxID=10090 RepID=Q922Q0_MOUSE|nr:RIKEN cDNA 1810019J16 gene [Mus musculus]